MNITPVPTFYNGQTVDLTQLQVFCVWDNLENESKFYYELCDITDEVCQTGNLIMTGSDYTTWKTEGNINLAAYQWVATQLNVTII